jgi:toxin-antitoxin system PIN domain toxin
MALFLPDANVLIYALHQSSCHHLACRQWLLDVGARRDHLGLAELVEVALLRIPTLPRLQMVPIKELLGFWRDDLWTYPGTRRLGAGPRHAEIFTRLLEESDLQGNDINDTWLAALAIEHKATLVSTDEGFARFPALLWHNPINEAAM